MKITSTPRWESWLSLKSNHHLLKLFVPVIVMAIALLIFFSSSYDTFFPLPKPSAAADGAGIPDATTTSSAADHAKLEQLQKDPHMEDKSGNRVIVASETQPNMNEYSQIDPHMEDKSGSREIVVSETQPDMNEYSQIGKCDLFNGKWIHNPLGPTYTNTSCHFIESPQNCIKNGRPDTGYLYWRWKPQDCNVDLFDAGKFLDAMRNKSWALIGDSIFRNHVQSLLCLLSKAEEPLEIYHDETFRNRRWHFQSHNFTLSQVWSPFLAKADMFEDSDGKSTSEIQLHLDTLDSIWTSQYSNFDYIVISGGQWFLKQAIYIENNTAIGCHGCQGNNMTEIGLEYPYHKVLQQLYDFISASDHKPHIIYRTWTPSHFENGEWFSGGVCNRTVPYRGREFNGTVLDRLMRSIELEEFDKAAVNVPDSGARLKLLDTYYLSLLRPDGHSGPYRDFHPFDKDSNVVVQNDCLHWCLPGPVDTWNDLIMELVLNQ